MEEKGGMQVPVVMEMEEMGEMAVIMEEMGEMEMAVVTEEEVAMPALVAAVEMAEKEEKAEPMAVTMVPLE
ncbi:hypothetical protein OFY30_005067 [Salmonella enterica]|nr:hypothetical protein [Salmonella enterica]EKP2081306.1 hypothetical protein [Salmonella enterica]EKP2109778.1 hypothetical protein [Salmonella enterica]